MSNPYNPDLHHRRSIRLRGYDYRQAGAYYVTICVQGKECLLGEIRDGEARLSDAGQMLQATWEELPQHYVGVEMDALVVMPNHIHGIIVLNVIPGQDSSTAQATARMSLPEVIYGFKSLTTTRYRYGVQHQGWQPFSGRLWQRNYYEHIIRDEDDLNRVREYILYNPTHWLEDENNPIHLPSP